MDKKKKGDLNKVLDEMSNQLPLEVTCKDGKDGLITSISERGWITVERKGSSKKEEKIRKKDFLPVLEKENKYLVNYILNYIGKRKEWNRRN